MVLAPQSGLRIVVADDDALILLDISGALQDGGFEVVAQASNGEELVEQCRRYSPDLIITDVRMPKKDGIAAVKEIYRKQKIPVIFITAFACDDVVREFKRAICLSKPFDEVVLKDTITKAMRNPA